MTGNNGIFNWADKMDLQVGGYEIEPEWWSRKFEYLWAINFAQPGDICADMGCGWMYRPFKDALADICKKVYAVDYDRRLLDLEAEFGSRKNLEYLVADITQNTGIKAGSLDRIYCISVLEDLGDLIIPSLQEFKRCLKPDGRIILTFDTQYDDQLPLRIYPGVNLESFTYLVGESGLAFDGHVNFNRKNAIHHREYNLCVFHCVLKNQ